MPEKLSMDVAFIQKLNGILDINLENEKFGVSELATEVGLSRSQLHRKLNDIKSKSSSQFIREYRLQKAMQMLILNEATASEIAYRVGFSSPNYFNTCFNNFYGYPPGEVKYQNSIAPPKKTYSKKLVGIIPVIIIIALITFNETLNRESTNVGNLEKTIAVLPFINDSDSKENMYFCNGIAAGIRDYLAKIPEFYVVSRLSAEQYRGTSSPLKIIANELDVNYVIEGHVQRIGDNAIISTELIQVDNNKILWSERYEENVSEIISVQAIIIESITDKLQTIISPSLKFQMITKPTQDTLAYDYYLKGEEYRFKANRFEQKTDDWKDFLNKSQLSYEMAIERDSLFAQAYVGLANAIYTSKNPYMLENSFDEVSVLLNKAIRINPMLGSGYMLRGNLYMYIEKDYEKAKIDFEKALTLTPNNSYILLKLKNLYRQNHNYTDGLIMLKQYEQRAVTDNELYNVYSSYTFYFGLLNDYKTEQYFFDKMAEIHPGFSNTQVWLYYRSKQFEKAIDYIEKFWSNDSQGKNLFLAIEYMQMRENSEALNFFKKWHEYVKVEGVLGLLSTRAYLGYGLALINNGQVEMGMAMIKKQIEVFDELISAGRDFPGVYYDLVGVYAVLEEYDKVYENMDKFEKLNGWTWWEGMVEVAKFDVIFDSLRDNPRFQEWIKRAEQQSEKVQKQIAPYLKSKKQ